MSSFKPKLLPEERTEQRRQLFLALGWPTSEEVAKRLHVHEETPGQWARARREANQLLGAWSPKLNAYVHPDFQFLADRLNPKLSALLASLSEIPGFDSQEDRGGWRRVFWLYEPRGALSEQSLGVVEAMENGANFMDAILESASLSEDPRAPADLFPTNPTAVIELALGDARADAEPL
jgi:hypothetical protein